MTHSASHPTGIASVGAMVLRYVISCVIVSSVLELVYWRRSSSSLGFLQLYITRFHSFRAGAFHRAVLMWDILFRGQLGFSISFLEKWVAQSRQT